ncbi:hypothetical protein CLOM_g23706 [Closterium sp. NIES-68]|nr:hypothetical protein CLOM_g23706 [Closterium sp. NIES-68]GJP66465.1 hypothetical protein CLOP_g23395 [Closterium sp. NIES-67]GJP80465.1 hypothetical protein CLOP_g10674 [Closterium sp. NIES-67]
MWDNLLRDVFWGVGFLAVSALVALITFQEKLLYVPVVPGATREYPFTPERLRMHFEDVWLTAKDGVKLHAWLLKYSATTRGPTILFLQENAGNIAHRLESSRYTMDRLHCNMLLLSYRGYGASEGKPTEQGLRLDAQAALDHLLGREDIDPKRIVVFGRSLGGAVGADLVHRNPGKVAALVVENTFTSVLDMAGVVLPVLSNLLSTKGVRPLNGLVRSQWRTIDVIGKVDTPILFLSGAKDELVPPAHMRLLYTEAQKNTVGSSLFVEVAAGGHMDTWLRGGQRYWRVLSLFITHHAGGSAGGGEGERGGNVELLEEVDEVVRESAGELTLRRVADGAKM